MLTSEQQLIVSALIHNLQELNSFGSVELQEAASQVEETTAAQKGLGALNQATFKIIMGEPTLWPTQENPLPKLNELTIRPVKLNPEAWK